MKPSGPPSVRFDPQRRARSSELRAAIKALAAFLEQREEELRPRKRARKAADWRHFRLAVEAIACNLITLPLMAKDRPLAVPRKATAMWRNKRYGNPVYGQHFLDAIDVMAHDEVNLIAVLTRGYRIEGVGKQNTTIVPTTAFAERFPPSLAGWDAIDRATEPEVLILKAAKEGDAEHGKIIDYANTRETRRLRKEVQRINSALERAPVLMVADGEPPADGKDGQPIDPLRRTVRRIFNNGSWREGGRLFDGFWESMRREDRFRLLRIRSAAHPEGEPIANVDFSQLFPRLAYWRVKATPPDDDLYDLIGGGLPRDGLKKLFNSLFYRPLRNWPAETAELFPEGTKLRDAVRLISDAHAPIARLFGTGVGYGLMFAESCILIEALGTLYGQGIAALPLHDSVLVARSEADAAKRAMMDAFTAATGVSGGKLKIDFGEEIRGEQRLRLP
jgi:hypothetical protein